MTHDPHRQASRQPTSDPNPSTESQQIRASQFASTPALGIQRPRRQRWRRRAVWLPLLFVAIEVSLLALGFAPETSLQQWLNLSHQPVLAPGSAALMISVALLTAAVGFSYRPLGGLQGFGALPLPALVLATNSVITAAVCCIASITAAVVQRALSKRDPQAQSDRRGGKRLMIDAVHAAVATLVAGATWAVLVSDRPALAIAVSTLLWVAIAHALDHSQHHSRSAGAAGRSLARFGLLWDALGWLLAASLALVATSVGLGTLVPILIGYLALLILGAAREFDRTLHLRRIRDLRNLGSMAQRLVPRDQSSELATQCLSEVRRTVDFSYFELRFNGSDGEEVFHSRARGPLLLGQLSLPEHPPPAPGIHTRRNWTVIRRDLMSRPAADTEAASEGPAEPPQRLGTLCLWIDPRNSDTNDEELIDDLVPQIAALIDRSRLDREARLDALTGLARRHVFDRELRRRFEHARDDGHSVALLLFDLDHFKQVNDGYGHDAGDRVLEAVGAILLRAAEPGGLACRWGGEELALLLWGSGDNALKFADEVRSFVAAQTIATDAGPLAVTASVGVSAFPDLLVQDPDELVKLADEALYAAKERGRNRALLALGRGRFKGASGELMGDLGDLQPEMIPQL